MTPLPKKKHSKSRSRTRHSTKGISLPNLITCSNCNSLKFTHRICPNCGKYGNENKAKIPDAPATENAPKS